MLDTLQKDLPDGALLTDPDLIERYRQDWARDPDAGRPIAVVRATRTEDVQAVLRWASAHRVPVVPRGAGSGLSGGSTAVDGGIVLSTGTDARDPHRHRCRGSRSPSPARSTSR